MYKVDDTIEVEIVNISVDGRGFAKEGDFYIFVDDAAPKDKVKAKVKKVDGFFIDCVIEEIIQKGDTRTQPACKHFPRCGGCDFLHIKYEEQIKGKKYIFDKLLTRAGVKQEAIKGFKTEPQFNFRYTSNYKLEIKDKELYFGYHKKKTNEIVDVYTCEVLEKGFNEIAAKFRAILNELAPTLNDCKMNVRFVRDYDKKRFMIRIDINSVLEVSQVSKICSVMQDFEKEEEEIQHIVVYDNATEGVSKAGRHDNFSYTYNNLVHYYDHGTFVQANLHMNKHLIAEVVKHVEGPEHCLELYAGNGNFTFSLAHNCDMVTAVELSRNGIFCLQKGLRANKIQNINATKEECLIFVRKAVLAKEQFDVVVLDPPRTGCKPIIPYFEELGVKKVVYVSCGIRSLARDIAVFNKHNFEVKEIAYFDMFPNTSKVEAVCVLEKVD